MQLFIDSANLDELKKAADSGLIDGVTTNPSLVAKEEGKFEDMLLRICEIIDGPISAEVVATDTQGMLDEGRNLAKIHPNIVIKLPLTQEGLKACKSFTAENVKTNVTLCFSPLQALLAAKAGATYVSPFIGRLDDIGQAGLDLIADIRGIFDNYGYETQILAASMRHVEHVLQSARMGADVATLPYSVFEKMFKHPLTTQGLETFLEDWKKAKK
jgi:transaldolase